MPRKPWASGGRGSHPPCRYLCLHSLFRRLQRPSRERLRGPAECSPTARASRRGPAVSVLRLAPLHCLRPRARPVSCYALFQGMAASEPTSRLSARGDLISHSAQFRDLDRRSGLFPSRPRTLEHAASLPGAGRGHSQFGAGRKASPPPSRSRALPPAALPEAVPKGISGRASYLQVCLAFHSVPRVIAALFNGLPFGPPRGLTPASACPWQDHLGFGSAPRDLPPFRTRFPSGSAATSA